MSRWHDMLATLPSASDVVQMAQTVQMEVTDKGFEPIEPFEPQGYATKTDGDDNNIPKTLDRERYEERAAVIADNGHYVEWCEGFALLCEMPRPRSYTASRWRQIVDDGGTFLDQWGKVAAGMGWRAIDAFGVNPRVPDTAYCDMGLVPLLGGNRVHDIRPDAAVIDCGQGVKQIYRRIIRTQAVALWQLRSR